MIDGEDRKYAAVLGRRYFAGTVTYEALFEHFVASDDPLIRELLLSILHEPRRGFWGVRESRWQESFWDPVSALLTELEKGVEGQVPPRSVVPAATAWAFLGLSVFTLWAGGLAAEHGLAFWRGAGPTWEMAVHAVSTVIMALGAAAGAIGIRNRILLRRVRRSKWQ